MRLEHFAPHQVADSIEEIDLEALRERGIKALILDLDNTLVPWRSEEISPERLGWVQRAKEKGFKVCLLSNTIFGKRLKRIGARLGVPCLGVWHIDRKPRRLGFRKALAELDCRPDEAVMVGDQLLADILGARRCGLRCVWVQPISRGDEFWVTKLARRVERFIVKRLRKRGLLPTPENHRM